MNAVMRMNENAKCCRPACCLLLLLANLGDVLLPPSLLLILRALAFVVLLCSSVFLFLLIRHPTWASFDALLNTLWYGNREGHIYICTLRGTKLSTECFAQYNAAWQL